MGVEQGNVPRRSLSRPIPGRAGFLIGLTSHSARGVSARALLAQGADLMTLESVPKDSALCERLGAF